MDAATPTRTAPARQYLSTREVAALYGLSEQTLHKWRQQGKGPRWHRLGAAVRYAVADCEAWAAAGRAPAAA